MLSLPPSVRVFLSLSPADLRRSFDGLSRLVGEVIEEDPFSGHRFVFRNRRGDRVKILYWDRDGFALWYKRLEAGTFRFPVSDGARLCVSAADLALVLEGIDPASVRRRPRYKK
ncbi:MAG: IS66 family insertion sequence element accessory protein TnpB [Candidatus Sumerlaeota bacterium]|nr:IS66 family insertion sequence element accessory protein TnpB [Candidatus Sumerlaeota bacterium]